MDEFDLDFSSQRFSGTGFPGEGIDVSIAGEGEAVMTTAEAHELGQDMLDASRRVYSEVVLSYVLVPARLEAEGDAWAYKLVTPRGDAMWLTYEMIDRFGFDTFRLQGGPIVWIEPADSDVPHGLVGAVEVTIAAHPALSERHGGGFQFTGCIPASWARVIVLCAIERVPGWPL